MRRALPAIVVFAAIARTAHAQPTEDARARAKALFDEGRQMMAEGKVPDACAKLEKSQELAPGVGTLINLGACWEQARRPARAYAMYKQALHDAAESGRTDRTRTAFERAKHLETKIARVRFPASHTFACATNVASDVEPGLAVLEPGTHDCRLDLEKRTRWSGAIVAKPGEEQTITPDPEKPEKPIAQPSTPPATPRTDDAGSGTRIAGWIVAGVGVVALGTSGFFALRATSKDDDAAGHCDATGCDPDGVRLGREAKDAGNLATIMLVAGSLVTAGGLGLVLFAPSGSSKSTARLAPWFAASGCGFGASGAF